MGSRLGGGLAIVAVLTVVAGRAAAASLDAFARCLTDAGVTYYAAAWCPHCRAQEKLFGDAIRYIEYVDCTHGCPDDDVPSFPTWEFGDGSRRSGVMTLDELARRTHCRLDARGERAPAPSAPGGMRTRERDVGGVRIIELPGS